MKRTIAFTGVLLAASMGAGGPAGSMCGMGMGPVPDTNTETDAPDGGMTDDGGTSDGGGGMPDGGGSTPDGGGMGSGSGKSTHLVNSETGEDLGYIVELATLTVFHEKFNGLVTYSQWFTPISEETSIYYPELDCKGKGLIRGRSRIQNWAYKLGPKATYLQNVGPWLKDSVVKSRLTSYMFKYDGRTTCENLSASIDQELTDFVDSGVKRRPPDDKLKFELR